MDNGKTKGGGGGGGGGGSAPDRTKTQDAIRSVMATFWHKRICAAPASKASGLAKWQMLKPVLELVFDGIGTTCSLMRDVLLERNPKILDMLGPFAEIFTVDLQYLCTGMKIDGNRFVQALSEGKEPGEELQHMNTSVVRFCLCLMKMNFAAKDLRKVKARHTKRKVQKTDNVLSKLSGAQQRAIRALPSAAFELTLDCMWPMLRTLLDSLTAEHLTRLFTMQVSLNSSTAPASLWRPILAQAPATETRTADFMGKKIVVRPAKARTVLDLLRYFDGKGVDIFALVDGKKTAYDLLKMHALTVDRRFLLVTEWMERALPGTNPALGPAERAKKDADGGVTVELVSNLFAPFSRIPPRCKVDHGLTGAVLERQVELRRLARFKVEAGADICNFCGKPGFQIAAERAGQKKKQGKASGQQAQASMFGAVTKTQEEQSLRRCSRCSNALYCCRDCQMAHWVLGHKNDCRVDVTV